MHPIKPLFLARTKLEIRGMYACVAANAVVIAFCLGNLVGRYHESGLPWPFFLPVLLFAYYCADVASGAVHWSIDTWFDTRTLGRAVSIAREHHTHPQNILGYGFLEHATLGSAPSALFVGLAALLTAAFPASPVTYALMIVWTVMATCLFFGTSLHNLGHRQPRSRLLRLAQRLRLVVTPEHHWVHHRPGQMVRYCAVNGWANPLCDRLRVWRRLERVIQAVTGAEPRRDDLEWKRLQRHAPQLAADPGRAPQPPWQLSCPQRVRKAP